MRVSGSPRSVIIVYYEVLPSNTGVEVICFLLDISISNISDSMGVLPPPRISALEWLLFCGQFSTTRARYSDVHYQN